MKNLIGKMVMVRTYSAGVHYGVLVSMDGKIVELENARRVWYWDGAATISQLAAIGTSKPSKCKFPRAVATIILTEAIEIIPMTEASIASLSLVPVWSE